VVIPPAVADEFTRLADIFPRFHGLTLPDGIRRQAPAILDPQVGAAPGLDAGEAAALSLAMEIKADAILLDERRGHEIAIRLGLRTIGILGILLEGKRAGLLATVRPILDSLERDANFWISEALRNRVLQLAGEV
jgi:predicted nucleic acid-binding protein